MLHPAKTASDEKDKLKNLEQQYKPHNVRRQLQRKDAMINKRS